MDIEDLFTENFNLEESKDEPMVIPEFGGCGEGADEESSAPAKGGAGACCSGKSLSCSTMQPCACQTQTPVIIP